MSSLYVKVLWVCTTDAGGMVGVIRNAACCWALSGAHQVLLWWCHGWGAITMSLHCLFVILIRAAFTFHGSAFQPMTCKLEVQNLTRSWITKDIKKLTALGVSVLSFPETFHSFFCCRFAPQQGCVIGSLLGAGLIVLVVSFRHWIPTSKEWVSPISWLSHQRLCTAVRKLTHYWSFAELFWESDYWDWYVLLWVLL